MLCPVLLAYAPGIWELAIIGVIVLLLFGNRLPTLMGSLGKSVTEFKKGIREDPDKPAERLDESGRKPAPRE